MHIAPPERTNRLRSSIWIQTADASIVIDSGPDFRYQMLRAHVNQLDAIVFTHGHKDHIAGLDDIRPYNFFSNKPVQVYAHRRDAGGAEARFPLYIQQPHIPRHTTDNAPYH